MIKRIGLGIIVLLSLILISGCSSSSPLSEEVVTEVTVAKDTAEHLDIILELGYGEVDISTNAENWVGGEIQYNLTKLEPTITYKLKREKGKITITQPGKGIKVTTGQLKNSWDLELTNDIPIDLKLSTGAADTNIDLRGTMLTNLDIDAGVGRMVVDLGGTWQNSFDVDMDMGVGQTTVILPKDIGVKIKASKGIGTANFTGFISQGEGVYHNEAFDDADVIISVNTDMGVGEANFELEK